MQRAGVERAGEAEAGDEWGGEWAPSGLGRGGSPPVPGPLDEPPYGEGGPAGGAAGAAGGGRRTVDVRDLWGAVVHRPSLLGQVTGGGGGV